MEFHGTYWASVYIHVLVYIYIYVYVHICTHTHTCMIIEPTIYDSSGIVQPGVSPEVSGTGMWETWKGVSN